MSILLQSGIRGISPQRLAPTGYHGQTLVTSKEDDWVSVCQKKHFVSKQQRFCSGDASIKELDSNIKSSSTEKEKKDKVPFKMTLPTWGVDVPLKISEMNKYVSEASKKLGISFSRNKFVNNVKFTSETSIDKEDHVHSFEHSLTKMNQSIASFYDTTYATNTSSLIAKREDSKELKDDDMHECEAPKTIGPLFPNPKIKNPELKRKRAAARREQKISRLSLESRTRSLVQSLKSAHSLMSKITRAEELCEHLIVHPECVWDASSEKVIPVLQQLTSSPNKQLRGMAHETLSLLGYVKQLSAPGIRILSIDGGGTRGLVTIEFLKALEKQTGCKTYQLFDYVCGVSTGALLAILICLYKLPLDRCEQLYKDCSTQMFTRNRVLGTTKLVWTYGFYDSQSWEQLLRKEMGELALIEFAKDPDVPKLSAVSSLIGTHKMTSHLFRTYNPPPGASSQYPGSCRHKVWEVVRASSAAPGYFESFKLGDDVHEDGGILTNNPTALGIHESRLLWPSENLHCVVSLGTGRYDSVLEFPEAKVSLRTKLTTIVNSATDTEGVHQTLSDLLPAGTYFRFNPYLSEEFLLDEIRPDKMAEMQLDAQMYARRNSYKLTAVSQRLMEKRKPQQVIGDWVKHTIEKNLS